MDRKCILCVHKLVIKLSSNILGLLNNLVVTM